MCIPILNSLLKFSHPFTKLRSILMNIWLGLRFSRHVKLESPLPHKLNVLISFLTFFYQLQPFCYTAKEHHYIESFTVSCDTKLNDLQLHFFLPHFLVTVIAVMFYVISNTLSECTLAIIAFFFAKIIVLVHFLFLFTLQ